MKKQGVKLFVRGMIGTRTRRRISGVWRFVFFLCKFDRV